MAGFESPSMVQDNTVATNIELVEGGNIIRQGHHLTLGYIAYDELGQVVDLSDKTVDVVIWGRKGIAYEGDAVFEDGVLRFTLDQAIPSGDYNVEFTATLSTDAGYRKKYPTNTNTGRISVKQSADDLGAVGISVFTIDKFEKRQKELQDAYHLSVDSKVETLEADFEQAVGALTVDSELKLARASTDEIYPTLKARLDDEKQTTAAQLAEKADESEVVKKGYGTLNDFDEPTRAAIQGLEPGTINAVLGEKNVTPKNTTFIDDAELFNGEYYNYAINGSNLSPSANGRTFICTVEPNTKYKIIKQSSNRFRVGLMENAFVEGPSYPNSNLKLLTTITQYDGFVGEIVLEFETGQSHKTLIITVSSISEEPMMSIMDSGARFRMKGVELKGQDIDVFEELDVAPVPKNLFNGVFSSGGISSVNTLSTSSSSLIAVVNITPGQRYFIHKSEGSDRFRIGTQSGSLAYGGNVKRYLWLDDPRDEEYFDFLATDGDDILIIQVTSQLERPKLTIAHDYRYLKGVRVMSKNVDGLTLGNKKYYLPPLAVQHYEKPTEIIPEGSIQNKTTSEIYGLYDNLVTNYPDYVSKEELRRDGLNNPINAYYFTPPSVAPISVERPKITITTGTHGDEKGSVWSAYQFLRGVCEGNGELAEYVKSNVIIRIIPLVSPSAFDSTSRTNHNGVNINRNFDYNWAAGAGDDYGGIAPFSEVEAQVVRDFIRANLDTFVHIDSHNTPNNGSMFIVKSEDKINPYVARNTHAILQRKWAESYPGATYQGQYIVLTIFPGGGTIRDFCINSGVTGYTLELSTNLPFASSLTSAETLETSLDLFGTTILQTINMID